MDRVGSSRPPIASAGSELRRKRICDDAVRQVVGGASVCRLTNHLPYYGKDLGLQLPPGPYRSTGMTQFSPNGTIHLR
jgi:hypothetical protein